VRLALLLVLALTRLSLAQTTQALPPAFYTATGVTPNGEIIKHQRKTTASIPVGGAAEVLTWTTAWSDAAYIPICMVEIGEAGAATLSVHHIEAFTASTVTVRINNQAGVGKVGVLHCIGLRQTV
jgi:hypothetical protein